MDKPFRTPSPDELIASNGVKRTTALFRETGFQYQSTLKDLSAEEREDKAKPIYTLKPYDNNGCVSAHRIYMACPTDYDAGITLFGTYEHWKLICEAPKLKPHVEAWREERLVRDAAMARKTLIDQARDGNVTAAKEIHQEVKPKRGAGRPSREEIEGEKKKALEREGKIANLLDRLPNR